VLDVKLKVPSVDVTPVVGPAEGQLAASTDESLVAGASVVLDWLEKEVVENLVSPPRLEVSLELVGVICSVVVLELPMLLLAAVVEELGLLDSNDDAVVDAETIRDVVDALLNAVVAACSVDGPPLISSLPPSEVEL
jgi:hypothetical protein